LIEEFSIEEFSSIEESSSIEEFSIEEFSSIEEFFFFSVGKFL
jgi:hypothetical protein